MPSTDDNRTLRRFGLLFAGVALVACVFLYYRKADFNPWLAGVGALFLLLAVLAPAALKPVYRAWMTFGSVVGRINAVLLLTLVYYLIVLPMGLIMRMFGWGTAIVRPDPERDSYYVKREKSFQPDSMRRLF